MSDGSWRVKIRTSGGASSVGPGRADTGRPRNPTRTQKIGGCVANGERRTRGGRRAQ